MFLGPGGAQYNAPQMYWKDIGTSVDAVYAHTFAYNRVYGRPIFPLGQVYSGPPATQISGSASSRAPTAPPVSAGGTGRRRRPACGQRSRSPSAGSAASSPTRAVATLGPGRAGDVVVWAQEHLLSAGQRLTVDGGFGPATKAAVIAFQSAHHLTATGLIDQATWQALLHYSPARVTWVTRGRKQTATVARALAARAGRAVPSGVAPVPRSANDRAKGYEIPRSFGAGRL